MATWTTATRTWTAGETVTAANMNAQLRDFANAFGAFGSYTPALTASTTSPTLGTGSTASGAYMQSQKWVTGRATIQFGTSGTAAGTGTYYVSLPVNAASTNTIMGKGSIFDSSAADHRPVIVVYQSATTALLRYSGTTTYVAANNAPWTWAASDYIQIEFEYEAA